MQFQETICSSQFGDLMKLQKLFQFDARGNFVSEAMKKIDELFSSDGAAYSWFENANNNPNNNGM